ncbi:hypothetical protein [Pseudomonas germanica]|uniref:HdeA/HdeB family protein n=1 Tax=Pseudomonas germanica TaxID=2815720 RepID=A0ABX8YVH6_9PSED|nr:hypothetical protein [Pseudomonas germanica]QYY84000.1 hypothetical protein J0G10_11335 [Pseudomonas germanica]
MRKRIAAGLLGLLTVYGSAYGETEALKAPYDAEDASYDARQVWLSGCSDFKNGLNEGDFVKWLRLEGKVKEMPQLRRTAVVKLYMDGWDTARAMKGVIACNTFAQARADDYASGIDIRQP